MTNIEFKVGSHLLRALLGNITSQICIALVFYHSDSWPRSQHRNEAKWLLVEHINRSLNSLSSRCTRTINGLSPFILHKRNRQYAMRDPCSKFPNKMAHFQTPFVTKWLQIYSTDYTELRDTQELKSVPYVSHLCHCSDVYVPLNELPNRKTTI